MINGLEMISSFMQEILFFFFNSRLKLFLGKLKSRWLGPYTVTQSFPYGTVEISYPGKGTFKFNGHCWRHYAFHDEAILSGFCMAYSLLKPPWTYGRYVKLVTLNKHSLEGNPSCVFSSFQFVFIFRFVFASLFLIILSSAFSHTFISVEAPSFWFSC